MKRNNLGYFITEGVRSVFLNGFMSFAAICVTIACLIIMSSFSLVLLNLSHMITQLEQENEILVYIDETYSQAEAKSVGSAINLVENVLEAKFVSREEAMKNFVGQYEDASIFDGMDASTLRHRFRVRLVNLDIMMETVGEIREIEGVDSVNAHPEIAEGFITVQQIMNVVSIAIITILFVVSVFIISNTVKLALFARREEIAIMRMVGATNGFIRWPFVVEGFILGISSSLGAFFIEWGIYSLLIERISAVDTMNLVSTLPFEDVILPMAAAFFITGVLVGVGGSLLSIRKFLKV